jgi:hypothetical protein
MVADFIAGMSRDEFIADRKAQVAVTHSLFVLGEADRSGDRHLARALAGMLAETDQILRFSTFQPAGNPALHLRSTYISVSPMASRMSCLSLSM